MRYLGASKFFTVDFFTWPYLSIVGGSFKRKYFTKDFYCSEAFPLFYRGTISIGLFAFELFSSSHFFPQKEKYFLRNVFFTFIFLILFFLHFSLSFAILGWLESSVTLVTELGGYFWTQLAIFGNLHWVIRLLKPILNNPKQSNGIWMFVKFSLTPNS